MNFLAHWFPWLAGAGVLGVIALLLTPWGLTILSALWNSAIGRWVVLALGFLLGLLIIVGRIFAAGQKSGKADVQVRNDAAAKDRQKVDQNVAAKPDDAVDKELDPWRR